jgi:serine/threonine protein kinase
LIGAGSFGHVFQALDQDSGALIAVKEVRTANAREVELVQREIEIMSSLEHPNVVRFLGSQTDSASGTVFVITEWVPGGSISSLVQRFGALTERTVRSYGRQLITVLAYLHARNVVHRDVKVGNWYELVLAWLRRIFSLVAGSARAHRVSCRHHVRLVFAILVAESDMMR